MTALNTEFNMGSLHLRNRLVLPPITTNYGSPEGLVTQDILDFYQVRSARVGLTIVEATAVNEAGRIVPNSLGLWSDDQTDGMKALVDMIHNQGAAAVVQLNHAGPRCFPDMSLKQGFSPSGIACRPDIDPIIMDKQDIAVLVDDFIAASMRAREAGFDGVEIHGAHLYLLSQFISPATNKRNDPYGGDVSGRAALAVEIVKRVRENTGPDYPVLFRMNAEERIESGLTLNDSIEAGKLLKKAGVDLFDLSLIAYGGFREIEGKVVLQGASALPKEMPSGANVKMTKAFKKQVGGPVICVGKFGAGPAGRDAIEKHGMDLLAIGRQMICDPQTAAKLLDEQDDTIVPCDECLACYASIGMGKAMACKVNKRLPL